MRRLIALAVVVVGATAAPAPAHAADPIEGTWAFRGGLVDVRADRGAFTGTVRRSVRFAVCTHRAGERMWRIFKGRGYSGRHLSFDDRIPGCSLDDRVNLPASFRLAGDRLQVRVARFTHIQPGACGWSTVCFTLKRVAAPSTRSITIGVDARPASGAEALGASYRGSALTALVDVERFRGRMSVRGTVDLVHDDAQAGSKHVRFRVTRVVGRRLHLRVASSELSACAAGATGTLVVTDARPDAVELRACGWALVFRGAAGSRVDVRDRKG